MEDLGLKWVEGKGRVGKHLEGFGGSVLSIGQCMSC